MSNTNLILTIARHEFTPIFSAGADADYSVANIERVTTLGTNSSGVTLVSDSFVEEHKASGRGSISASWLIRDIGRITTAFTADFLRFVTKIGKRVLSVLDALDHLLKRIVGMVLRFVSVDRHHLHALRGVLQRELDHAIFTA